MTKATQFIVIQMGDLVQSLGVFDNANSAYGRAYLFLSEITEDEDMENCYVTFPYELEGDTGFGIDVKEKGTDKVKDTVFILFDSYKEFEDDEHEQKETDN